MTRRQEGQRRRRERERHARCVELPSGARLDLRAPDPSAITFDDVALRLAACPRFAGEGIPVAAHSVLVCRMLQEQGEPEAVQLAGLMHDCAEAFTGDLIKPTKALIPGWRRIEERIERAIMQALGLDVDLHAPVVKAADVAALAVETLEGYDGIRTRRAGELAFRREYARLTA